MTGNATTPRGKKLIEVDLPLDVININTKGEPIGSKGHPWTLQQWWARRRLTACRVIIFASMVDDPSAYLDDPAEISAERRRLHDLIERLSLWKNSGNENLLNEARYEIACSVARQRDETAPTEPTQVLAYLGDPAKHLNIYDPFSGGAGIPLEAQRLGMRATGTDLNPVAVLIAKALIELPPQFAARPPVNPDAAPMGIVAGKGRHARRIAWRGAAGLANDVRYYGRRMRELAHASIGHLYPDAIGPDGKAATVLAWLWARTLPCPSPACGVHTPLVPTFQLSGKPNNQHWIRPVVDSTSRAVSFTIQNHNGGVNESHAVSGKGATCLSCGTTISGEHLHEGSTAGKIGQQMVAIYATAGKGRRSFIAPTAANTQSATGTPPWRPPQTMPNTPTLVSGRGYGFTHWHQLFNERQLTAISTLCGLLPTAKAEIISDGANSEYANAVCTYLALAIGKAAMAWSTFGVWNKPRETVQNPFGRQALPMRWMYPEANPFSEQMQSWSAQVEQVAQVVADLPTSVNPGTALQADAATTIHVANGPVIVTDPPYYNNIDYADLSDYLYVWLRHALRDIYPDLFAGILTPKDEEMVAVPSRFENPTGRFESLLRQTLQLIKQNCSPDFPSSIFYAYKQQEEERDGSRASTGWETMLSALVTAGFQIVGTWPIRTENTDALKAKANVLASSIILVCRPRPDGAPMAFRDDFQVALEREMPTALDQLTRAGHIAPVDLRQAAIGPGMAVYSRFRSVETLDGETVTVRQALAAINNAVDAYLQQEAGQMDNESRFCLEWLRNYYPNGAGDFGSAETLARTFDLSVTDGLKRRHNLLEAEMGTVTLHGIDAYGEERAYPRARTGMTAWEACLRMAWQMQTGENRRGVDGCIAVAQRASGKLEQIERLARVLYDFYDRKGDSRLAVSFNNLVVSWADITAGATQQQQTPTLTPE